MWLMLCPHLVGRAEDVRDGHADDAGADELRSRGPEERVHGGQAAVGGHH